MALNILLLLASFLLILYSVVIIEAATVFTDGISPSLNRSSFPDGFIFGTASSAYQCEGAANVSGREPSIWDTHTHNYPEKIFGRSNGDVAIDEYHRYKEDVEIMKDLNMDAYRFSISWSRVIPKGKLSRGVNMEGISYYNNLINELLDKGIEPFVTLFHWDLPQILEEEYGGFLSPNIVNDFRDYAELCFKEFGDRVKHWITLNEPWTVSKFGYADGWAAPGRCSSWLDKNCTGGDSATEPYIVAHNQLVAHATAVKVYKTKYQASQKGLIGITLSCDWMLPLHDTESDIHATQRAIDFILGWFMDPLTGGDYPISMRSLVGSRLPKFSKHEIKLVKGERNGIPIGPMTSSIWKPVYPKGIHDLLLYTKTKYNNPLIYITENGIDELNDPTLSLEEAFADTPRIDYYYSHLHYLQNAIKDGVNVKGYFAWSLLDDFEWTLGYVVRTGINFVDYKNGLKRYPKMSAIWFKKFLQKKKIMHSDLR